MVTAWCSFDRVGSRLYLYLYCDEVASMRTVEIDNNLSARKRNFSDIRIN